MKCSKCGFEVGEYPFCSNCGNQVAEVPPNVVAAPFMQEDFEEQESLQLKPKRAKRKKIVVILAICLSLGVLALVLSLTLGGSGKNSARSPARSSYGSGNSSYSRGSSMSRDDIERAAASALYSELLSQNDRGIPFSNRYNLDSTRYSIGSITENRNGGWTVKGTFSLYDDYGKYKKSGTFIAEISEYGFGTCTIKLD